MVTISSEEPDRRGTKIIVATDGKPETTVPRSALHLSPPGSPPGEQPIPAFWPEESMKRDGLTAGP